jgi:hypothetical protein
VPASLGRCNHEAANAVRTKPAASHRFSFHCLWQPDKRPTRTVDGGKGEVSIRSPAGKRRHALCHSESVYRQHSARTKQPLIVRLQAPRFFVVGDTVTISAVINNTDEPLSEGCD